MKELVFVYVTLLVITIAGCTNVKVRQYDVNDPNDREAIRHKGPLQLVLTNGEELSVSSAWVSGDSLRFFVEHPDRVANGQVWRFPKAVAIESVVTLKDESRKVNGGRTVAVGAGMLGALVASSVVVVLGTLTCWGKQPCSWE